MAKVKVTLEYEYEGEEKTNAAAISSEKEYWTSGAVSVDDIVAAGGDFTLDVAIIGDVAEEAEDDLEVE